MTNYEKMKSMSKEEILDYLIEHNFCVDNFRNCDCDCRNCVKKWLESEVEENKKCVKLHPVGSTQVTDNGFKVFTFKIEE